MIGGKCGIDTKGWWFVFAVYICLLSKHIQFNFHEYIHERVTRCLLLLPWEARLISANRFFRAVYLLILTSSRDHSQPGLAYFRLSLTKNRLLECNVFQFVAAVVNKMHEQGCI